MENGPEPGTGELLYLDDGWVQFADKKWNKIDIDAIANMKRKGLGSGDLEGKDLENFVVECLKSGAYDYLSFPVDTL
jgi:hypothetical protein